MYDLKLQDARDEGIAIGMEQGRLKIQDARDEGIAIGMEKGKEHWIKQGVQQGMQRGIEQERNKLLDILNCGNVGLSDEQKKIVLAEFSR